MAYSSISFLLQKLANLAIHEASLLGEMGLQMKLLRNHLQWMQHLLQQASRSRTSDRLWVDQIREVCFDVEEIVDDYMVRVAPFCHQGLSNLNVFRLFDKLRFAHSLNARMKKITIVVDQIMLNKERYGIEKPWSVEDRSFFQQEDLLPIEKVRMDTDDHVGMHSDVERVKRMILNEETAVVSILGLGGLGKTTLARRVYNDDDVKKHFNFRAWVSIPQGHTTGELLMRVADSVMTLTHQQKREAKERERELEKIVRKFLETRTYLIVLDELWSSQAWDVLSCYFPPSSHSKVLITASEPIIPPGIKSAFHKIQPLSKAGRLELFLKRAFLVADTNSIIIPADLKALAMSMADKCGSFPLTAALLGGLLSRKQKTWKSWMWVLRRLEWHENNHNQACHILRIISFSFEDLPYYLKSCFLYCGLFPEDHEINARKLMNLWIAEGFIQKRGEETLEETAQNYLEELIQRSMVQMGKRRSDGVVKFCYVHDMIRDFIISEATETKFFEVCKKTNFTTPGIQARRLAFHHHLIDNNTFQHSNTSHVRSLICFTDYHDPKCLTSLIQGRKLLTVLDLGGLNGMKELPKQIGKLIHLKYLSLRGSGVERLPKSIGELCNLQTLDLRDNPIKRIPHTIWKLHELRHLYGGEGVVSNPFLGIGQLKNLQVLAIRWDACLKDDGFEDLEIQQDPMLSLEKLPNLRILRLLSSSYVGKKMVCSPGGFPKLESLTLRGWIELEELIVKEGAMPELRCLKVEGCPRMTSLPQGLLRNLEQLKLVPMSH